MSRDTGPAFTLVEEGHEAYAILEELVGSFHTTLSEARISLVWAHKIKADRDGHLVWGTTRKVSAKEQMYHEHDFEIVLNADVWQELSPEHRKALLDHELSHCGSSTDDDGEVTYHIIKHDLEEFVSIVRRHGLWRDGIEAMVNAALERRRQQEERRVETATA